VRFLFNWQGFERRRSLRSRRLHPQGLSSNQVAASVESQTGKATDIAKR